MNNSRDDIKLSPLALQKESSNQQPPKTFQKTYKNRFTSSHVSDSVHSLRPKTDDFDTEMPSSLLSDLFIERLYCFPQGLFISLVVENKKKERTTVSTQSSVWIVLHFVHCALYYVHCEL